MTLAIGWEALRPRVPQYQGHNLYFWLNRLDQSSPFPWPPSPAAKEAGTAILAMGTNSLPYLIYALTNRDSTVHDVIQLPLWRYLRLSMPSVLRYKRAAARALAVLGPAAKSATPVLAQALNESKTIWERRRAAADGLGAVGPEGWTVLTKGLLSTNQEVRLCCVEVLAERRVAGPGTVDVLMFGATNGGSSQSFSLACLRALGQIGHEAGRVVPFLTNLLQSTNVEMEMCGAEALGAFGTNARSALPAFMEIVHRGPEAELGFQPASAFTNCINTALERIDPEAAQQARSLWRPLRLDPGTYFRRAPAFEQWLALGTDTPAFIAGTSLAEWLKAANGTEPQYHGHSVREWLTEAVPPASSSLSVATLDAVREHSKQALAAIGTNGIPWFLAWLETAPSENSRLALRGFTFLGENARPALTPLFELVHSRNQETRNLAYGCLRRLGMPWDSIWPGLVPVLHDSDLAVRGEAADFLWNEFPEQARNAGLREFTPPFGIVTKEEP